MAFSMKQDDRTAVVRKMVAREGQTGLGAIARMVAASHAPMAVWTPKGAFFTNTAFQDVIGPRWAEIKSTIDGTLHQVLTDGIARSVSGSDLGLSQHDLSLSPAGEGVLIVALPSPMPHDEVADFSAELAQGLASAADASGCMRVVAALTAHTLRAAQAGFARVDSSETVTDVDVDWTDGRIPSAVGRWSRRDLGLRMVEALRQGRTVAVGDVGSDARMAEAQTLAAFAASGIRAILNVPLCRDGRLVGVFYVHDVRTRQWSSVDVARARTAAATLWNRLESGIVADALRLSETRLARATAAARVFAWECDLVAGTVTWPGNAAEVIGCAQDELPSDLARRQFFVLPEDRPLLDEEMARLLALNQTDFEAEFRGLSGQIWRTKSRIEYAENGTALRVLGVTQDVTEAVAARTALARSEHDARVHADEMQALYDAAPAGLCVLDRDLRFVRINAVLAATNGLSIAEHLGQRIGDVLPDFRGAHEERLQRVLDGEEFRGLIVAGESATTRGATASFQVNWLPLRDAVGAVQGILISAEDITALQEADRALEEREALLAAVGASSPDLIYAKDQQGRMLYANPAALLIADRTWDQIQGRQGAAFLPRHQAKLILENDMRVMTSGQSGMFDERVTAADGRDRVYQSTKAPLRDAQGKIIGVVGVSVDMTDQRLAEARAAFLHYLSDRLRNDPCAARVTAKETGLFFSAVRAGFALQDAGKGGLVIVDAWTDGTAAGAPEDSRFDAWTAGMLAAGQAVVIDNCLTDPRITNSEFYQARSIMAAAAVPVVRDGDLMAAVFVHLGQPRRWSEADVLLIEEVARRTWAAVEREQTEEALRIAQERYRTVLSTTTAVVWTTDAAGEFATPQDSWTRHTGQPWPDQAGSGWIQMIHPDDRKRLMADWQRAIASGELYASEGRILDQASGSWRHFLVRGAPMRDAGGAIVEWIGAITDIEALRQAERDLRDNAQLLRIAQDAAGLGIFELDCDSAIFTCDARSREILGQSDSGPRRFSDVLAQICPDCRATVAEAFSPAHGQGDRPLSIECRLLRHGQVEPVWIAITGSSAAKPLGGLRIVGSLRDVTARRQADAALNALNTQLESRVAQAVRERSSLWALSEDLLVTSDMQGVVQEASESWRRMLGWDPADLNGRPFQDLLHPDDLETAPAQLAAILSPERAPVSHENRVRSTDGTWRLISWRVSIETEANRLYAIGRDVTAERAQAEALAATQGQLHEVQKLEIIGQLTGVVAHDFNNLLSVINANLSIARKRTSDSAISALIDTAIAATDRGVTLTGRLLAFSRRQELRAETIRPERLIAGVAGLLSRTLGASIALNVDLAENLSTINVDVNQLELAILNLAVNARDAMPEGGTLTIAGRESEAGPDDDLPPGMYLVLSLTDTGVGMDEVTRRRAAEPFFTTKEVGKGAGLGLSMVHGLAAQSGGALKLFSSPGAGTRAELWLPRSFGAAVPFDEPDGAGSLTEADRARRAPLIDSDANGLGRLRLLVVDDDVLVAMGTTVMLEDMGHEVVVAHSAAQALRDFAQDGPFDAVITDHIMPAMTGAALAKRLQGQVPVILASGYADLPDEMDKGLPRLDKPFGQKELEHVLRLVLGR